MQASAILIVVWIIFRAIGAVGFSLFVSWKSAFPYAFAVMLIFTTIGHFKRRHNLQAMVPGWIVDPELVVLITGVLELAGAAGLLFTFYPARSGGRPGSFSDCCLSCKHQIREGTCKDSGLAGHPACGESIDSGRVYPAADLVRGVTVSAG